MTSDQVLTELRWRRTKLERIVHLRKDFWREKYKWVVGITPRFAQDEVDLELYEGAVRELETTTDGRKTP